MESFLDLPSFLVVFISILACALILGGGRFSKMMLVTNEVAIPIGVSFSLVGYILMSSDLSEPEMIGPVMSIALLSFLYSVFIYMLSFLGIQQKSDSTEKDMSSNDLAQKDISSFGAYFKTVGVLIVYVGSILGSIVATNWENLYGFIDIPSIAGVLLFVCFLSVVEFFITKKYFFFILRRNSILGPSFLILVGVVQLLVSLGDTTMLGPTFSLAFNSMLYGCILYVCGTAVSLSQNKIDKMQSSLLLLSLSGLFVIVSASFLFSIFV